MRRALALIAVAILASVCTVSPTRGPDVNITLADHSIASEVRTFKAGVIQRFVVANIGGVAHELRIVPPHTGSAHDAHGETLVHVKEADLQVGVAASATVTLPASARGKMWELACHLPGHYEAGMKLAITIE